MRDLRPDLLILGGLGVLLVGVLTYIALFPPGVFAAAIDRLPPGVALRNTYGVEYTAAGAYRWAKPEATIAIPVGAPGRYRVVVTLQDSAEAIPPRVVAIMVNGRPIARVPIDATRRDYAVEYDLTAREWLQNTTLLVGLSTAPLIPPADPRPLGPSVSRVALELAQPGSPWQLIFLPWRLSILGLGLTGLLLVYLLLRAGDRTALAVGGRLGAALLLAATFAVAQREAALRLALQATDQLPEFGAAFLALLGIGALVWWPNRVENLAPSPEGDSRVRSPREPLPALPASVRPRLSAARRDTVRDCLFLGLAVLLSLLLYVRLLGFYGDDWLFMNFLAASPDQSFPGLVGALWQGDTNLRQRPVQIAQHAGLFGLFGLGPTGYHLVNGAVFGLAIILGYLALCELGMPRRLALMAALLYALLPHYATDRFWLAASMTNISLALYLVNLLALLRLVRGVGAARWWWMLLGIGALLGSGLAYEVTLPLFVLNLALFWYRTRQHAMRVRASDGAGGTRAWVLAVFGTALHLAALLAVVAYKVRVTVRLEGGPGLGSQVRTNLARAIRPEYAPYEGGLNLPHAVAVGYGDLGVGLPRMAWGLVRAYPDGAILLLGVLFAVGCYSYLRLFDASPSARWPPAIWWAGALGGGIVVFLLGYAIFLANAGIQFSTSGISNRTAIAAALGIALSCAGVVGWACALLPVHWRSRLADLTTVSLCLCGFLVINTLGQFWGTAHAQQRAVLDRIHDTFATLPTGGTLLLDGVCPYAGPALVFEVPWDLAGALAIGYGDPTLSADIVTPRLRVEDGQLVTMLYGGALESRYPYGETTILYDYARDTVVPLTSAAVARRHFAATNPDLSGGCPPGHEGFGVRLLPWGHP